jgi:Zn-dependent M28 family amino/carboxypeptidase
MVADVFRGIVTTTNVLAELPAGHGDDDDDDGGASNADAPVIVVGAHLDSVPQGPGIQDNGSGSAAILEIALQLADEEISTQNRIRFAWWGAEEFGLVGSTFYVANLTPEGQAEIKANVNLDMIGSPNFVRFVYDGDGSAGLSPPGPAGSEVIEQLFLDHYADRGLANEPTAFSGRSDYGPFIAVGIPAGGLFTGAEVLKTPEQVLVYGGVAGEQYDQCYHQACDTFDNINLEVYEQNTMAAADVILQLADMEMPLAAPAPVAALRSLSSAQSVASDNTMDYLGNELRR